MYIVVYISLLSLNETLTNAQCLQKQLNKLPRKKLGKFQGIFADIYILLKIPSAYSRRILILCRAMDCKFKPWHHNYLV